MKCEKCGRTSRIAPHALHARYRASVAIGAVRLRCSACGSKEVTWQVLEARPPRGASQY